MRERGEEISLGFIFPLTGRLATTSVVGVTILWKTCGRLSRGLSTWAFPWTPSGATLTSWKGAKDKKNSFDKFRSLDFTVDQENFAGLPDFVRDIQSMGHKFVTILDPGLSRGEPSGSYPSFEAGQENNVWIVGEDGEPVTGNVWPEHPVYYVDFTKPEAKTWWKNEIVKFHGLVPWDGLWIDMNEPSNMVISIKPLLPTIFRLQEMWMLVV